MNVCAVSCCLHGVAALTVFRLYDHICNLDSDLIRIRITADKTSFSKSLSKEFNPNPAYINTIVSSVQVISLDQK